MFFKKNKAEDEIASATSVEVNEASLNMKKENEFLKSFINEIYNNMIEILDNQEQINEQHGQLAGLAEDVKNTIESVKSISAGTSDLSEYLTERSEELNGISKNSVSKSIEGEQAVNNLIEVMNSLQVQSKDSSITMTSLGERSKEITEIIKTITDIASQMTFIALHVTGAGNNHAYYASPEYDGLVKKVQTSQGEERLQAMVDAEKLLAADLPIFPVYNAVKLYLQKEYVKGVERHAAGADMSFKNAYILKH